VIARLEGAQNQKQEGKRICIEMMQQCAKSRAFPASHVMAYRQESWSPRSCRIRRPGRAGGRGGASSPDDERVAERLRTMLEKRPATSEGAAAATHAVA
jgi:hypothetical protein